MKTVFRRQSHLHVGSGSGGDFPPDDGDTYVITNDDSDVATNSNAWVNIDPSSLPDNIFVTATGDEIITLDSSYVVFSQPDVPDNSFVTSTGDNIISIDGSFLVY